MLTYTRLILLELKVLIWSSYELLKQYTMQNLNLSCLKQQKKNAQTDLLILVLNGNANIIHELIRLFLKKNGQTGDLLSRTQRLTFLLNRSYLNYTISLCDLFRELLIITN